MRRLILALLLAIFATPALASTFALSGYTAPAGTPVIWTINRTSGHGAQCVALKTSDGTAKAGIDYTALNVVQCFTRYQTKATVSDPTHINLGQPGQTLRFSAVLTVNGTVVSSAASFIVEPPPQPATIVCPDGEVIPAGTNCPPPPPPSTQTCPDGSVIPITQTCPVPAPAPPPAPPSPGPGQALALQACPALNRNESLLLDAIYNVIEFGQDALGNEFVVLGDATHRGDGVFALYVPVGCVQLG